MIDIVYTINFLTNGGPTRVLQNIINNLDKSKYNVMILTLINQNNQEIVNNLKKDGIKIIELNYEKKMSMVIKQRNKIINLINKINPQIIHTHGIVSTIIVSSNKVKAKKITTIHNNIFEDYRYTYGNIKGFIYALMHIYCLKKFDETICCSKTSYNVLKNILKRVSYIRNGINVQKSNNSSDIRQKIRKELNIDDTNIVYVYGGVINERKRVVELVKMFSNALKENENLLIVGDGPQMENAKINANKKVIFVGFKENIIDYFQASDIYVSNSASEGFSISVIEALSCGLLCLLSDIPSHKECFEIDQNYYIGEYFNKLDFNKKKDVIFNKIKTINKQKLIEFQEKYLSAEYMTSQYEKYYYKYIE